MTGSTSKADPTTSLWLSRALRRGSVLVEYMLLRLRLLRYGIWRFERVRSYTNRSELLQLHRLARSLGVKARVLEIGAYVGSASICIAAAIAARGGGLICVDTWLNDAMPEGDIDTYEEFTRNTKNLRHAIVALRKRSEEVLFSEIGGMLNMVFIDANHEYENVRSDVNLTLPWLSEDAFLVFHDCGPAHPGVARVIGEVMARGEWYVEGKVGSLVWMCRVADARRQAESALVR